MATFSSGSVRLSIPLVRLLLASLSFRPSGLGLWLSITYFFMSLLLPSLQSDPLFSFVGVLKLSWLFFFSTLLGACTGYLIINMLTTLPFIICTDGRVIPFPLLVLCWWLVCCISSTLTSSRLNFIISRRSCISLQGAVKKTALIVHLSLPLNYNLHWVIDNPEKCADGYKYHQLYDTLMVAGGVLKLQYGIICSMIYTIQVVTNV